MLRLIKNGATIYKQQFKHIYLKRVLHGGIPGTLTINLKDILH